MLPLFFGRRDLADLTETIMGDVKTIEHAYSHVLPELYGAYIMLGAAAVGLVAFDWRLAIAALWSAPVALGLLFGARRALQPMMHATRMRGLAISEDIQEALECVREVRATNQEERYLEHIRADIDAAERQAAKSEIACGVCVNGAQIVLRLGIATTILVGSMLVLDGFTSKRLDVLLRELRQYSVSVPYKAIVTEHNLPWTLRALYDELVREHEAMHG